MYISRIKGVENRVAVSEKLLIPSLPQLNRCEYNLASLAVKARSDGRRTSTQYRHSADLECQIGPLARRASVDTGLRRTDVFNFAIGVWANDRHSSQHRKGGQNNECFLPDVPMPVGTRASIIDDTFQSSELIHIRNTRRPGLQLVY